VSSVGAALRLSAPVAVYGVVARKVAPVIEELHCRGTIMGGEFLREGKPRHVRGQTG
jgi:hypothetical protein